MVNSNMFLSFIKYIFYSLLFMSNFAFASNNAFNGAFKIGANNFDGNAFTPVIGKSFGPEIVVRNFYSWYMSSLADNKKPIIDEKDIYIDFIAYELYQKLAREQKTQILNIDYQDYFFKADDYFDDWINNITVKPIQIQKNLSTVALTLGDTKKSYRQFTVFLNKDDKVWKIYRVIDNNPS